VRRGEGKGRGGLRGREIKGSEIKAGKEGKGESKKG